MTRVLLRHAGSSARLISARAHNEQAAAQQIVALLGEGKTVALVSDAGTPAISDPGAQVVAQLRWRDGTELTRIFPVIRGEDGGA